MDRVGDAERGKPVSKPPSELEGRLGHVFRRPELLAMALVHRSSTRGGDNNEKLEFLGDAVLGLAVSDLLMEKFPMADEGELSRRRAGLVNARALAARAGDLGLGTVVRLGKGEEKSGGRRKASILAGAYEAVLGAIYLDGGYGAAREVVASQFAAGIAGGKDDAPIDHKTHLQEITQRLFRETPLYALVEATGPEHDRAFVAELRVRGKLCGRGAGKTKKEAEQEAAKEALRQLEREAKPSR